MMPWTDRLDRHYMCTHARCAASDLPFLSLSPLALQVPQSTMEAMVFSLTVYFLTNLTRTGKGRPRLAALSAL